MNQEREMHNFVQNLLLKQSEFTFYIYRQTRYTYYITGQLSLTAIGSKAREIAADGIVTIGNEATATP